MSILDTARTRPPPPPPLRLSLQTSASKPQDSTPFLYNSPSSSRSPTRSTTPLGSSRSYQLSPTSSTFSSSYKMRGGAQGRARRTTPPPADTRRELEEFAAHCRSWYYDQDDASGRAVSQIMNNLPTSQRAPYIRLQAAIRSAYHASTTARRLAEFKAQLSSTHPGGSLTPLARANLAGPVARKERYERFSRFVRAWCTPGIPGTTPFFHALWAIMRLQTLPNKLGGAGSKRLEWEFDDAVFQESAGKDFMLEAIDILKGVLGFSDTKSSSSSDTPPASSTSELYQPEVHQAPESGMAMEPIYPSSGSGRKNRIRAPSDPFLDTPTLSRSVSSSLSGISAAPQSPTTIAAQEDVVALSKSQMNTDYERPPEKTLRTWVVPDLSNAEFHSLESLFPTFVSTRGHARFTMGASRRKFDLEEGLDQDEGEGTDPEDIRCGTGRIWIGSEERGEGWNGGWWTRFVDWWKRLFC
ncbi:hypothetical protein SISSUDRAFT_980023 [Sistotremastrum suecicum HHB10207 ss-3]|uniref:Uncharacterized protein n=1 Tax=Sistotremastrum suecicum HHB10207 ss-3 TaxID=1314776 RepID=A0A166H7V4_9AGAM|nr:hypothetical protein SISSUDRAFT_980023 [Sistotremastrum suecicum HHB10207 ss-3]